MLEAITFLGVRTSALEEMTHLYRDVFGLKQLSGEREFVAFETPNHDRVEVFGPGHRHSHLTTGPVGGFEVADIGAGAEALREAGVALVTPIQGEPGRTRWIHYRAPDGCIYELVHHPNRPRRRSA